MKLLSSYRDKNAWTNGRDVFPIFGSLCVDRAKRTLRQSAWR
jgi:hypothetical protein